MNTKIKFYFFAIILSISILTVPFFTVRGIPTDNEEIEGVVGDILVYQTKVGENYRYQKFNLTNIQPVDNGLNLSYNIYSSTLLSNFSQTPDNETYSIITTNLTESLFSNNTFYNVFLLMSANFTEYKDEFLDLLTGFGGDDDSNSDDESEDNFDPDKVKMEIKIGTSGLSFRISMYYRIIFYIKMMEMDFYYSTTRVLLRTRMWFMNPMNSDEAEVITKIVPSLSTPEGVDEDPFNPLGIIAPIEDDTTDDDDSTNDDTTEDDDSTDDDDTTDDDYDPFAEDETDDPLGEGSKNFIFDTRSIMLISGGSVVILGVPTSIIIYTIKHKKKVI